MTALAPEGTGREPHLVAMQSAQSGNFLKHLGPTGIYWILVFTASKFSILTTHFFTGIGTIKIEDLSECLEQDNNIKFEEIIVGKHEPVEAEHFELLVENKEDNLQKNVLYQQPCDETNKEDVFTACFERVQIPTTPVSKSDQYDCEAALSVNISHKKSNSGSEIYKCESCAYETRKRRNLKRHIEYKHNSSTAKVFICAHCHYESKVKSALVIHLQARHSPCTPLYKCDFCNYETKVKQCLARHFKTNHDPDSTVYKCGFCDYETKDKYCFRGHCRRRHDPIYAVFRCEQCSFETTQHKYLYNHSKRMHGPNNKLYKCEYCDYDTKSKPHLNAHCRRKHVLVSTQEEGSKE